LPDGLHSLGPLGCLIRQGRVLAGLGLIERLRAKLLGGHLRVTAQVVQRLALALRICLG